MDFVSIDVETANADMASICQIGIARYSNGNLVDEWSSLINPQSNFDPYNVNIHGISARHVALAPIFSAVYDQISELTSGNICVCHTHFNRVSLNKITSRNGLAELNVRWLDSARIVRRTWSEMAFSGYGLESACSLIGYDFKRNDALEDAKACGAVVNAAVLESKASVVDWMLLVEKPILSGVNSGQIPEGNPDGELFGYTIVFTGALSITRNIAAEKAAKIGCTFGKGVTKQTDYLVVGDQDINRVGVEGKSAKQIKAEKLIAKGQDIRILQESDFLLLVESSSR